MTTIGSGYSLPYADNQSSLLGHKKDPNSEDQQFIISDLNTAPITTMEEKKEVKEEATKCDRSQEVHYLPDLRDLPRKACNSSHFVSLNVLGSLPADVCQKLRKVLIRFSDKRLSLEELSAKLFHFTLENESLTKEFMEVSSRMPSDLRMTYDTKDGLKMPERLRNLLEQDVIFRNKITKDGHTELKHLISEIETKLCKRCGNCKDTVVRTLELIDILTNIGKPRDLELVMFELTCILIPDVRFIVDIFSIVFQQYCIRQRQELSEIIKTAEKLHWPLRLELFNTKREKLLNTIDKSLFTFLSEKKVLNSEVYLKMDVMYRKTLKRLENNKKYGKYKKLTENNSNTQTYDVGNQKPVMTITADMLRSKKTNNRHQNDMIPSSFSSSTTTMSYIENKGNFNLISGNQENETGNFRINSEYKYTIKEDNNEGLKIPNDDPMSRISNSINYNSSARNILSFHIRQKVMKESRLYGMQSNLAYPGQGLIKYVDENGTQQQNFPNQISGKSSRHTNVDFSSSSMDSVINNAKTNSGTYSRSSLILSGISPDNSGSISNSTNGSPIMQQKYYKTREFFKSTGVLPDSGKINLSEYFDGNISLENYPKVTNPYLLIPHIPKRVLLKDMIADEFGVRYYQRRHTSPNLRIKNREKVLRAIRNDLTSIGVHHDNLLFLDDTCDNRTDRINRYKAIRKCYSEAIKLSKTKEDYESLLAAGDNLLSLINNFASDCVYNMTEMPMMSIRSRVFDRMGKYRDPFAETAYKTHAMRTMLPKLSKPDYFELKVYKGCYRYCAEKKLFFDSAYPPDKLVTDVVNMKRRFINRKYCAPPACNISSKDHTPSNEECFSSSALGNIPEQSNNMHGRCNSRGSNKSRKSTNNSLKTDTQKIPIYQTVNPIRYIPPTEKITKKNFMFYLDSLNGQIIDQNSIPELPSTAPSIIKYDSVLAYNADKRYKMTDFEKYTFIEDNQLSLDHTQALCETALLALNEYVRCNIGISPNKLLDKLRFDLISSGFSSESSENKMKDIGIGYDLGVTERNPVDIFSPTLDTFNSTQQQQQQQLQQQQQYTIQSLQQQQDSKRGSESTISKICSYTSILQNGKSLLMSLFGLGPSIDSRPKKDISYNKQINNDLISLVENSIYNLGSYLSSQCWLDSNEKQEKLSEGTMNLSDLFLFYTSTSTSVGVNCYNQGQNYYPVTFSLSPSPNVTPIVAEFLVGTRSSTTIKTPFGYGGKAQSTSFVGVESNQAPEGSMYKYEGVFIGTNVGADLYSGHLFMNNQTDALLNFNTIIPTMITQTPDYVSILDTQPMCLLLSAVPVLLARIGSFTQWMWYNSSNNGKSGVRVTSLNTFNSIFSNQSQQLYNILQPPDPIAFSLRSSIVKLADGGIGSGSGDDVRTLKELHELISLKKKKYYPPQNLISIDIPKEEKLKVLDDWSKNNLDLVCSDSNVILRCKKEDIKDVTPIIYLKDRTLLKEWQKYYTKHKSENVSNNLSSQEYIKSTMDKCIFNKVRSFKEMHQRLMSIDILSKNNDKSLMFSLLPFMLSNFSSLGEKTRYQNFIDNFITNDCETIRDENTPPESTVKPESSIEVTNVLSEENKPLNIESNDTKENEENNVNSGFNHHKYENCDMVIPLDFDTSYVLLENNITDSLICYDLAYEVLESSLGPKFKDALYFLKDIILEDCVNLSALKPEYHTVRILSPLMFHMYTMFVMLCKRLDALIRVILCMPSKTINITHNYEVPDFNIGRKTPAPPTQLNEKLIRIFKALKTTTSKASESMEDLKIDEEINKDINSIFRSEEYDIIEQLLEGMINHPGGVIKVGFNKKEEIKSNEEAIVDNSDKFKFLENNDIKREKEEKKVEKYDEQEIQNLKIVEFLEKNLDEEEKSMLPGNIIFLSTSLTQTCLYNAPEVLNIMNRHDCSTNELNKIINLDKSTINDKIHTFRTNLCNCLQAQAPILLSYIQKFPLSQDSGSSNNKYGSTQNIKAFKSSMNSKCSKNTTGSPSSQVVLESLVALRKILGRGVFSALIGPGCGTGINTVTYKWGVTNFYRKPIIINAGHSHNERSIAFPNAPYFEKTFELLSSYIDEMERVNCCQSSESEADSSSESSSELECMADVLSVATLHAQLTDKREISKYMEERDNEIENVIAENDNKLLYLDLSHIALQEPSSFGPMVIVETIGRIAHISFVVE